MFLEAIDAGGIEFHLPRSRIIMSVGADRIRNVVVIQLSDACRKIPVLSKRLRHTQLIGNGLSEDLTICVDSGTVGVQARE